MSAENLGSANGAGSPAAGVPSNNSLGGSLGQTPFNKESQIDPAQHKELESLAGRLGQEVGEYRKFFGEISPLLDKLDKQPELIQAILDDKIDASLAKAALEGKISISDAKVVTQAHNEVKGELGKKYDKTSPEDIEKMVEEKISGVKKSIEDKIALKDEETQFENNVKEFISRTPDFTTYAEEIDKWLDSHDITDIAVAYYAVKGELSEKEAKKQAAIDQAEYGKELAMSAGGGSNRATHIRGDASLVDQLIGGKSNPNVF